MNTLVCHGPKDIRYGDVPGAALARDSDAAVRITSTAICRSYKDAVLEMVMKP